MSDWILLKPVPEKKIVHSIENMFYYVSKPYLADFLPVFKYLFDYNFFMLKKSIKDVFDYVESVVQQRREQPHVNSTDFLDLLLDDDSFNNDNVVGTCMNMIAAGVDTSSTTLAWMTVALCNYPDVQKKAQEEIDRVIGKRLPSMQDVKSLPYVNAVILELTRWKTVTPLALPHKALEDIDLDDGYIIPKDAIIWVCQYSANMDESKWENPSQFNPERFLSGGDLPLTFSVGPRQCAGMSLANSELFLGVTRLIQQFNIKSATGKKIDETEIFGLTYQPKNFEVLISERK